MSTGFDFDQPGPSRNSSHRGTLASDYVQSHARRVDDVMTSDVWTVTEEAPLGDIVALMEQHRIKRLPVMRGDEL